MVEAIVWIAALAGLTGVFSLFMSKGALRHRQRIGPAAMGTVYDMLNEDKRNAVEIIVEGRAEARDPEDKDGNLPDLEDPGARGAKGA